MEVTAISRIQFPAVQSGNDSVSSSDSLGFAGVLQHLAEKTKIAGSGTEIRDIASMQQSLESGKMYSPRELILFQVKASAVHLKVELVSRSAETVHGTIRRLQQGQ